MPENNRSEMKLIVKNPNNIVQNAFVTQNEYSFSLIINTVDRWIEYNSNWPEDNKLTYFYEDNGEFDEITLEAENESDITILARFKFYLHDKNQLHILMPASKVYPGI